MSKFKFALCLICMTLVAGCAAVNWQGALDTKMTRLNTNGIVLAKVTFEDRTSNRGLSLGSAFINKSGFDKKQNIFLQYKRNFKIVTEKRDGFLIMLELEGENDYFIDSMNGMLGGTFCRVEIPISLDFRVNKNEIVYIGNIHLILRKKVSDEELRAGPILPLYDQLKVLNKTFDVEIRDKYEENMLEFEVLFPGLKESTVLKRLLPPWESTNS